MVSVDVKHHVYILSVTDYSSIPFRLFLLFRKVVVCGLCLVTLSLTINETLNWPSSLPILMQESFWWWQCIYSDRYIISLFPHLHPSLVSRMFSVAVKHQKRRRMWLRPLPQRLRVLILEGPWLWCDRFYAVWTQIYDKTRTALIHLSVCLSICLSLSLSNPCLVYIRERSRNYPQNNSSDEIFNFLSIIPWSFQV